MDVRINCPCPPKADGGTRHDADTVTLRDRLDFHGAISTRNQIAMLYLEDAAASAGEVLAVLSESYILFGVESWTLVDEKGKAIIVTRPAIREHLLGAPESIGELIEAADELYAPQVMLPLLAAAQKSSPPSPIKRSTSAKKASGTPHPTPLKRSSTTTTPTGDTGTTSASPDGGSSSSLRSA